MKLREMSEHKFNTTPSKTINKPKQNNPKGYNYDCNLVPYLRIASVECNLNGISSTIEICFVCNVIPHQIYIYRYIYVENKHDTTHIHTHTQSAVPIPIRHVVGPADVMCFVSFSFVFVHSICECV